MKYIIKGKEPNSLKAYRSTPGVDFDGCNKGDIRDALLAEQNHVCAYCMQRISNDLNTAYEPKMDIEHYKSQKRFPKLILNYHNMLGVCNGNSDKAKHKLICDKAKSKYDIAGANGKDLTIDLQNSLLVGRVKYTVDGEVFSDDEAINDDLNTILNLNEQNLKAERADVYKKIRSKTGDILSKGGSQVRRNLLKEKIAWAAPNNDAKLRPLAAVAIYVIDKRLRKLGVN